MSFANVVAAFNLALLIELRLDTDFLKVPALLDLPAFDTDILQAVVAKQYNIITLRYDQYHETLTLKFVDKSII